METIPEERPQYQQLTTELLVPSMTDMASGDSLATYMRLLPVSTARGAGTAKADEATGVTVWFDGDTPDSPAQADRRAPRATTNTRAVSRACGPRLLAIRLCDMDKPSVGWH